MTEDQETSAKSPGISERGSDGVTGPSREVSQRDENMPCTGSTGQDHDEPARARLQVPEEPVEEEPKPAPRLVERKTELRGLGIGARREPQSTTRRRTERDLAGRDPEVPCIKTEKAIRDLVCSLMERQDRMNEEIFSKINDLGYRLDDAEGDIVDLKKQGRFP
jgi:hypothetical protein